MWNILIDIDLIIMISREYHFSEMKGTIQISQNRDHFDLIQ